MSLAKRVLNIVGKNKRQEYNEFLKEFLTGVPATPKKTKGKKKKSDELEIDFDTNENT